MCFLLLSQLTIVERILIAFASIFSSQMNSSPLRASKPTTQPQLNLSSMAPAQLMSKTCTIIGFVTQPRSTWWVSNQFRCLSRGVFIDYAGFQGRTRAHKFFVFVLVMGRLFPQQLVFRTAITRAHTKKSCPSVAILGFITPSHWWWSWTSYVR